MPSASIHQRDHVHVKPRLSVHLSVRYCVQVSSTNTSVSSTYHADITGLFLIAHAHQYAPYLR